MRGKGLGADCPIPAYGITPACAGKSFTQNFVPRGLEDHPRVCGEKYTHQQHSFLTQGSPPRVRGKAFLAGAHIYHYRITPACAGKSLASFRMRTTSKDHPRVCGEKSGILWVRGIFLGSPPRVRGKDFKIIDSYIEDRITPACAGKSFFCFVFHIYLQDHPRVCGEKRIGRGCW